MSELTIDIPKGKYCGHPLRDKLNACPCIHYGYCDNFKERLAEGKQYYLKCNACKQATKKAKGKWKGEKK